MTLGVVLGGGGIAGVGWEAGIVIGLRRAGVDLHNPGTVCEVLGARPDSVWTA